MLRTPAQRKTLCKECAIAKAADLIGDSCSLLIVRDLLEKPRRFGDLQVSLCGISTRTLTKKLQHLESNGVIERREYSERPPRVEYTLTNKGAALTEILSAMRSYGKKYL